MTRVTGPVSSAAVSQGRILQALSLAKVHAEAIGERRLAYIASCLTNRVIERNASERGSAVANWPVTDPSGGTRTFPIFPIRAAATTTTATTTASMPSASEAPLPTAADPAAVAREVVARPIRAYPSQRYRPVPISELTKDRGRLRE